MEIFYYGMKIVASFLIGQYSGILMCEEQEENPDGMNLYKEERR